jgi:hypothetical protein
MKIYDKTIDAISAPKALDPWELELFHPLCITLRAKDLDLLERLLLLAERNETEQAILDFVETEIERERLWYQEFDARVDQAYTQVGLVYDAEENPFFC